MNSVRFFLIFVLIAIFFSTSAQSEHGKFSPEAKEPGESKILLVDDDMELWYSGPYIESTHIVTALNDAGYSAFIMHEKNDFDSFLPKLRNIKYNLNYKC